MIKSISIITDAIKEDCVFDENQKYKLIIDVSKIDLLEINSFDVEIVFEQPVSEFRNHDYTWIKSDKDWIANEFSPKIIRLQNGQLVQANLNCGIWEISKKDTTVLLWRFNPKFAESITNYINQTNSKNIESSKKRFYFSENPALLFPQNYAVEFSRSKYPFTAIACFTDHCDFDTAENLAIQRKFFKENQIKITKGFFLNHFSKRDDNASFQNNKEELLKWKNDGHELCYHSLSQSIKSEIESFEDFKEFIPPFNDLKVWIDHGYQPYNFSLLKKSTLQADEFEKILTNKNISILWNYIDSGTSTRGVINQLNNKQFTLGSFLKGNKDKSFVKKAQLLIKNIIFHYYNDEKLILKYQSTAGNFKKIVFQKKMKSIFPFVKNSFDLFTSIFVVILFWKASKDKPYKLAKYSPIVFKHIIDNKEFYVFQTLEMLDFHESLSEKNIDMLIKEKGVFVAHTYFSVPLQYHNGRLLSNSKTINKGVVANFNFLGNRIRNKEIWNPTLSELIEYWTNFEKVVLDVNSNGELFVETDLNLHIRKLN